MYKITLVDQAGNKRKAQVDFHEEVLPEATALMEDLFSDGYVVLSLVISGPHEETSQ